MLCYILWITFTAANNCNASYLTLMELVNKRAEFLDNNVGNQLKPVSTILFNQDSIYSGTVRYFKCRMHSYSKHDGFLSKWIIETTSQIGTFKAHTNSITCLSSDATYVYSASADNVCFQFEI